MSNTTFALTEEHRRWARARARQPRFGKRGLNFYLYLIEEQKGLCAFSQIPLIFDRLQGGGYIAKGPGCHPAYAALDHRSPGSCSDGFQIICYAFNDLKGHLPLDCFLDLCRTESWQRLMSKWQQQAEHDLSDRQAFRALLRPPFSPEQPKDTEAVV